MTVSEYLEFDQEPFSTKLLTQVEDIANDHNSMGRLRERVQRDLDLNRRLLLVSSFPRARYARVPGSSILFDATIVPPPAPSPSPSPSPLPSPSPSPGTCTDWSQDDSETARALEELGQELCQVLDELLFETVGDELLELARRSSIEIEALSTAGLVLQSGDQLSWVDESSRIRVRSVLPDVIASFLEPQAQLGLTLSRCWSAERRIRRAIRGRAKAVWSSRWSQELLGDELSTTVVSRASNSAYPNAATLEDVRDPLEWLTLEELFDVRRSPDIGNLGVPEPMWARIENAFVAIRERVNWSRLLEQNDDNVASRYEQYLKSNLRLSGARDPEQVLSTSALPHRALLRNLQIELGKNPSFTGDIAAQVLELLAETLRYVTYTLDTRLDFTARLKANAPRPLESSIHAHFKQFLAASALGGRVATEVDGIGTGRADVVVFGSDGTRLVTEVKRELKDNSRVALESNYVPQAIAYQSANVPFSQLLVLDLTDRADPTVEHVSNSLWVAHRETPEGQINASVVVAVVRGNRGHPSQR